MSSTIYTTYILYLSETDIFILELHILDYRESGPIPNRPGPTHKVSIVHPPVGMFTNSSTGLIDLDDQ